VRVAALSGAHLGVLRNSTDPQDQGGIFRQGVARRRAWTLTIGLGRPEGGSRRMSQQGVVKFFNTEKGYGFIKPDDGGRDIFVHVTAVTRAGLATLNQGQKVTYDVEPDKKGKGPKAVNLIVLEG
jgi:CspA family cold shock protein